MGLTLTRPYFKVLQSTVAIAIFGILFTTQAFSQCIEFTKGSTLSFGADGQLNVGDEITFTFFVENCGTETLTNVTVSEMDASFSGTGVVPLVPNIPGLVIAPGVTKEFITTYQVTEDDLDAEEVFSQGIIEFDLPDGSSSTQISDSSNILDDEGTNTDITRQALPALPGCPALACNDLINLSLNGDCESQVTVDMILEGVSDIMLIGFTITLLDETGNLIPDNLLTAEHLGQTVSANVTSTCDGNSCWGNIFVEDKLDPTIECNCPPGEWMTNPDCQVNCLAFDNVLNGAFGSPDISDNCDGVFAVLSGAQAFPGNACGEFRVQQTWSLFLEDEHGNEINTGESCVSEFYVFATDLTDVTPPNDISLECSASGSVINTDPSVTGYPRLGGTSITSSDQTTCNIISNFSDVELPICTPVTGINCNAETFKLIRSWTVLNWCTGESIDFIQQIQVEDNTPPVIEMNDQTVSIDPWQCVADVYLNDPTVLSDNCSSDLDWFIMNTDSGAEGIGTQHALAVPRGVWTFTVGTSDCCGNISTVDITVTVEDNAPPLPVIHQNIVVGLTISGSGDGSGSSSDINSGTAKIFKQNVDNGSFDICSNTLVEIRRESQGCSGQTDRTYSNLVPRSCDDDYASNDDDKGETIAFCCNDLSRDGDGDGEADGLVKVWVRVWDDANQDGVFGSFEIDNNGKCEFIDNFNETWAFIRVENKLEPIITAPDDVTINCYWDPTDLSLTGSGVSAAVPCEDPEFDFTDWVDVECGEGQIERNWFVVGNEDVTATQIITVVNPDAQDPLNVNCPGNGNTVQVDCDNFDIPEPTFTGSACSLTGISSEIDTFLIENACYKVIQTWTIIDWCSGITEECQFVLEKIDTDAPDIMCEDSCFDLDDFWDADNDGNFCELASNITLTKSATDDGECESSRIRWTVLIDYGNDGSIEEERSSFFNPNSSFFITPTDPGQNVSVSLNRNRIGSGNSEHRVEFKAFDGCGNFTQCTEIVTVADKKAPTPYCVGVSTALMEVGELVEISADKLNIGSFDNCTAMEDLIITFDNVAPVQSRLNQVHFFGPNGLSSSSAFENGFPIQRWDPVTRTSSTKLVGAEEWCGSNEMIISVFDEEGNTDFCTVEIFVDGEVCSDIIGDGNSIIASIEGELRTENGTPIDDVMVTNFSDQPNYPVSTPVNQSYAFTNNLMYQDYELVAAKDNGHINGVSTLDLVMIQRHILSIEVLDSPYKLVAADVNNSASVTAADLVELRRLILGLYSSLPENTSWRFVEADVEMDPSNPWPLKESISVFALEDDMADESFIGIKVGDVNNSVVASAASQTLETRSSNNLELIFNQLENGLVEIKAGNNFEGVYGYQFSIETQASLENVIAGTLAVDASNFGEVNNALTTSFSNATAIDVNAGDVLFTLDFDGASELSLNDQVNAEAYVGDSFTIYGIELRTGEETLAYGLMQNEPNPFSENTSISFTIPQRDQVSLTVFDLAGKTVAQRTGTFEAGLNTIQLDRNELNTTGVLYYQIESGSFSETKKMIVLK